MAEAIATVEGLVDHFGNKDLPKVREKDDNGKSGGDLAKETKVKEGASRPWKKNGKRKTDWDSLRPRMNYFLCSRPH